MRAILAGLLLSVVGTGCESCGWCRRDAESVGHGSSYVAGQPGVGTPGTPTAGAPATAGAPGVTTGTPAAPTAPAAPAGRPTGVGAYGGTGN